MPTEPLTDLLDRDLSKAAAKDIIENDSALLREIVNYATNAWARCAGSAKGEENEDIASTSLYYHMIEMTDGIEALVSEQCIVPAVPLLRSSFEANMSLEYIFEADYVDRSLAWLVQDVRRRIALYESMDPSTERGKQAQSIIAHDDVGRGVDFSGVGSTKENVDRLERLLKRQQFEKVIQEYDRLRSKRERNPQWYRLFGSSRNLHDLARHLNKGAQYEFLYRHWSEVTHATTFQRIIVHDDSGISGVRRMRDPSYLGDGSSIDASLLLGATRSMLARFRQGEETSVKKWYISEVRPRNQVTLERRRT
jgi:hypothetical protein